MEEQSKSKVTHEEVTVVEESVHTSTADHGHRLKFIGLTKMQFVLVTLITITLAVFISLVVLSIGLRQSALANKKTEDQVNTLVCDLTQSSWHERGEIMDGLILAAIHLVETRPEPIPGDAEFVTKFTGYHNRIRAELSTGEQICKP